ncbi:OmpW family outer membrane protein [Legionella anisa]|uniref:Porin family protein n=1 Tax=Legionella anisa TaxID=28082 RepID=A0AAX0WSL2_9GAMM|nr:OmpW family outer membrane protein [Legionella anisa]AWN74651.1 porin family protein [Legionella anisa]KTC77449.1 opacity protein-like surface antigen [Legionella anisa]MCW8425228.1 outer membrane beta-barrel protein [Legionella anisa]MCW8449342.1 outer membrane beta-barrel protein [Legionella anisa]PNL61453.1 porin family protein [Legionella anisa]
MKLALFTTALLAAGTAASSSVNGWYASGFGGYTYSPSNVERIYYDFFYLSDVHYRWGYNAGGGLGYQSNPIRYEFQYTYLYVDTNQYSVNHRPALDIDGGTKANILMANLYYDFPEKLAKISPFLGVGIGYAFMHATLNSTSRFKRPHFNVDQNSFAYQGTAGLTYNIRENFAINAAYRYFASTDKSNWGKNLQAHMANVGVVYRFDIGQIGSYK